MARNANVGNARLLDLTMMWLVWRPADVGWRLLMNSHFLLHGCHDGHHILLPTRFPVRVLTSVVSSRAVGLPFRVGLGIMSDRHCRLPNGELP